MIESSDKGRHGGRKPIGERAMTPTERKRRSRARRAEKLRAEQRPIDLADLVVSPEVWRRALTVR